MNEAVTFDGLTLTNGKTGPTAIDSGGAILAVMSATSGGLTIRNSTLAANTSTAGHGGAVYTQRQVSFS